MSDVTITVDGKKVTAPAGTLLIEACKRVGIEIPSFCYYPNLSLQGACRMCLVEIAKMPKLQTACTTVITEGMVVTTESATVRQARKAMLEFVLENHPLDCPVCDAGGQCELQDATLSYGASESRLIDIKNHRDEQQWSPIVYFDRPRCIMCYRCVRVCGEGMDVWALGIANRNSSQLIVPNKEDYLQCEECGMCIDICPVGALTSGPYRYKTRPWEMKHVATVCTHCADGCTTTLGLRPTEGRMQIIRGSNRDKAGINGDFLCIKGRYAFDFVNRKDRLTEPLIRQDGRLRPATWDEALSLVVSKFKETRDTKGGAAIGVIGSNRLTNEESYLLQKFARLVLQTNNIDHHRTTDYPGFVRALRQHGANTATMQDVFEASAILVIGGDPTYQHPLLAWQIRNNVRLHHARLYLVNEREIKLKRQATELVQTPPGTLSQAVANLANSSGIPSDALKPVASQLSALAERIRQEEDLVIIFGSELTGSAIETLVRFGSDLSGSKFICLGDHSNSRGAADMGIFPDLLPGYLSLDKRSKLQEAWGAEIPATPGLNLLQMFSAAGEGSLSSLYIVGANPILRYGLDPFALRNTFVVVQDLFLTETATIADVVLPAASAYEKAGTFTNTCGETQRLRKAADIPGSRSDLEIFLRMGMHMGLRPALPVFRGTGVQADIGQSRGAQSGEADRNAVWVVRQNLEPRLSPFDPELVMQEIRHLVPGYSSIPLNSKDAAEGSLPTPSDPNLILPSTDDLFSSGTFGRYSDILDDVLEKRIDLPYEAAGPSEESGT
ncbi:MAG TPA: NADH-quinone oxidoreductase subunit NuoG [Terriglobales bacterium]|nr:NADH-quinone oxidoreductase subunit NuoG [Terriglobales bacterium]